MEEQSEQPTLIKIKQNQFFQEEDNDDDFNIFIEEGISEIPYSPFGLKKPNQKDFSKSQNFSTSFITSGSNQQNNLEESKIDINEDQKNQTTFFSINNQNSGSLVDKSDIISIYSIISNDNDNIEEERYASQFLIDPSFFSTSQDFYNSQINFYNSFFNEAVQFISENLKAQNRVTYLNVFLTLRQTQANQIYFLRNILLLQQNKCKLCDFDQFLLSKEKNKCILTLDNLIFQVNSQLSQLSYQIQNDINTRNFNNNNIEYVNATELSSSQQKLRKFAKNVFDQAYANYKRCAYVSNLSIGCVVLLILLIDYKKFNNVNNKILKLGNIGDKLFKFKILLTNLQQQQYSQLNQISKMLFQ